MSDRFRISYTPSDHSASATVAFTRKLVLNMSWAGIQSGYTFGVKVSFHGSHIRNKLRFGCSAMFQALAAARVTDSHDVARVDLRLDRHDGNRPYVLEVNSLPGMAAISELTLMAEADGWTQPDLINVVVDAAARRYGLR